MDDDVLRYYCNDDTYHTTVRDLGEGKVEVILFEEVPINDTTSETAPLPDVQVKYEDA